MSLNSNYLPKARGTVAISDEELRCLAPSIFASQPIEGVSDRYSFLPTSSILKGMRENGWVPVRAEQQSVLVLISWLRPYSVEKNETKSI
jgi:hypothetical protein